jgi:hypothetical protein
MDIADDLTGKLVRLPTLELGEIEDKWGLGQACYLRFFGARADIRLLIAESVSKPWAGLTSSLFSELR